MATNPCVISNLLASDFSDAVKTVNRKFSALRRLANLLEQLGDVSSGIPNLSALVPVSAINIFSYAALVAACPFLNLPQNPTDNDLAKLRKLVDSAYQRLINDLKKHPWLRMGRLQSQLDKVQSDVSQIVNEGAQYLKCLQQACSSAAEVTNFVKALPTDVETQITQYTNTITANGGNVLNSDQQQKQAQVTAYISTVAALRSTPDIPTATVNAILPSSTMVPSTSSSSAVPLPPAR